MTKKSGALPAREMRPGATGVFINSEENAATKNLTRTEVADAVFAFALPRLREKFAMKSQTSAYERS